MTWSLRRLQDSGDRRHLPFPFLCFAAEPFSSLLGQDIVLSSSAILGGLPFTSDQSGSLQPLEGNKQRTSIHAEDAPAYLFDADGNPISVHGFERQRFQNEHV